MIKNVLLLTVSIFIMVTSVKGDHDTYFTDEGFVKFFSSAPLEDITATNNRVSTMLNIESGDLVFRVPIRSFQFAKGLMQVHFNEKRFMYTDEYPHGNFNGRITNIDEVNLREDGEYEIHVVGDLEIRGVTQPREETFIARVNGNEIEIEGEFQVAIADHEITIPGMFTSNIAEVVDITLRVTYHPYER